MPRLNDVQSATPNLIASARLMIETQGEGFVEITRDVAAFLLQIGAAEGVMLAYIRHTSAPLLAKARLDSTIATAAAPLANLSHISCSARRAIRAPASPRGRSFAGRACQNCPCMMLMSVRRLARTISKRANRRATFAATKSATARSRSWSAMASAATITVNTAYQRVTQKAV